MLADKHILIGVTGGIAAYKAAMLVSALKKRGAEVKVVMSKNATNFVAPLTFETLSGNRVYLEEFEHKFEIEHVALAKWADAFVVAPATANFLAKAANGLADDLISTTALAVSCPVLIAPAMNSAMWINPATQENFKRLVDRGMCAVGPESGHLACGDDGAGRMSEPEIILEAIEGVFNKAGDLSGKRVLVTAGPTIERIDPVRYITNRSSGKMGYAVAAAARERGAEVTLVSGPVNIPAPKGVELVTIEGSADMCREVLRLGPECDVIIQAAAPADFTPSVVHAQKIKKSGDGMTLELKATVDIARELGKVKRPGQVLVIFAAETENLVENARGKLKRKNADLVVANDVTREGSGFGTDTNAVTLITGGEIEELDIMSKRDVADKILDRVVELGKIR